MNKNGSGRTGTSVVTEIPTNIDFNEMNIDLEKMPVLPLREAVIFPWSVAPVGIGREKSRKIVQDAYERKSVICLTAQLDPDTEDPQAKDLYRVGVSGVILRLIDMPDGSMTAIIQTQQRLDIQKFVTRKPYLCAKVELRAENVPPQGDKKMTEVYRLCCAAYMKMLSELGEQEKNEMKFALKNLENPLREINFMCMNSPIDAADKQKLLEKDSIFDRAELLCELLSTSIQLMKLKNEIDERTRDNITQAQKEHFLQQQIRTIQDELGGTVEDQEGNELRARAKKKSWSEEAARHFEREMAKLDRLNVQNPEYSVQYAYLDTLLSLPWDNYSPDDFTLAKVEKILDKDHYGLDEVKDRIIEQMAVIKLRSDMKAPILCLVGPPGVGKTSLGHSIAQAMGREYARISLGGLRDEAEIRGHRRTYIGALPGRVMNAIKKLGTSNPVIVLDEVDKISSDYKGDPSTALLEVLDPEQNNKFHDNYIDTDYDLSKVLFIATANSLDTISRPLLDRMEVISISGYVADEKVEIARRHLVPKALAEHGFAENEVKFSKDALRELVNYYTREAGVRQLEKKISKVLRKIARKKVSDEEFPNTITPDMIHELIGQREVIPDAYENNDFIGVVTGLAWTQVGGEILFIEASLSEGKGEKLTLTGNLGNVMKESAMIALQYLKAYASEFGIDSKEFTSKDVHIHVPEGAIPKDGPSAGIALTTALASAFTNRKVKPRLAMTGEMTLRGKVLPVGGIKEKILAAKRAGINTVILCSENRKDVEKINSQYLKGLTFEYVDRIDQVLNLALI